MITNLRKLLNPQAEPMHEVTLVRGTFINGTAYSAGERLAVTDRVRDQLTASGVAVSSNAEAELEEKRQRLESIIPPPVEPRPIPDGWQALPECFRNWWNLNQQGIALEIRQEQTTHKLIALRNRRMLDLPANFAHAPQTLQLRSLTAIEVNQMTTAEVEEDRHLADAIQRQFAAVAGWREGNLERLLRLKLQCGDELMSVHGKACRTITELHETAYQIFKMRISALGLSESENQRLFAGSADAEKYHLPMPTIGDIKLAWSEPNGEPRYYVALSPLQMGEHFQRFSALLEVAERMLAEAKRELAATRKASKAG